MDRMTFREPNALLFLEQQLDQREAHRVALDLKNHPRKGEALRLLEQMAERSQGRTLQTIVTVMAAVYSDAPGTLKAYRKALLHESDSNRWLSLWWGVSSLQLNALPLVLTVMEEATRQWRQQKAISLPFRRLLAPPTPCRAPATTWLKRLLTGAEKRAEPRADRHTSHELLAEIKRPLAYREFRLDPSQVAVVKDFDRCFGSDLLRGVALQTSVPKIPGPTPRAATAQSFLPGSPLNKRQVLEFCRRRDGLGRFRELMKRPELLCHLEPFGRELYFELTLEDFLQLWISLDPEMRRVFGGNLISMTGSKVPREWLLQTLQETEFDSVAGEILRQLQARHAELPAQPQLVPSVLARFPGLRAGVETALWRTLEPQQAEFPLWEARLPLGQQGEASAVVCPNGAQILFSTSERLSLRQIGTGKELASHLGADLPVALRALGDGAFLAASKVGGRVYGYDRPLHLLMFTDQGVRIHPLSGPEEMTWDDELRRVGTQLFIYQERMAHDWSDTFIHEVSLTDGTVRRVQQVRGKKLDRAEYVALPASPRLQLRAYGQGRWVVFDKEGRRLPFALHGRATGEREKISFEQHRLWTLAINELESGVAHLTVWPSSPEQRPSGLAPAGAEPD